MKIRFEDLDMFLKEHFERFIETHNKVDASYITLPSNNMYSFHRFITENVQDKSILVSGFNWEEYKPGNANNSNYYWRFHKPNDIVDGGVTYHALDELLDSFEASPKYFTIIKENEVNLVNANANASSRYQPELLLLIHPLIDFAERNFETLGASFLHSVVQLANSHGFNDFSFIDRDGKKRVLPDLPDLNSPIRDEILSKALLRAVADKPMVFARFFNEERAKRGIVGHVKQKEVQKLLEEFLES